MLLHTLNDMTPVPHLNPIPYLTEVCSLHTIKAIVSGCVTILFVLFGDDMTALNIAIVLLIIDTVTGRVAAGIEERRGENKVQSSRAYRLIEKMVAIFSLFITANLLGIFTPEVRDKLIYVVAASVIWVEGMSIFENVERIDNRLSLKKVRDLIPKIIKK